MKFILTSIFCVVVLCSKASQSSNIFQQLNAINTCWSEQTNIPTLPFYGIRTVTFSDQQFIQLHLQLVESILRGRPTSQLTKAQQATRSQNLDNLHQYWLTNTYPINNKTANRNPVFIDDYNTFCAVGYLIKTSGREDLARKIAATNNLSYIRDMRLDELNQWVEQSGLTLDELAWIQPGYLAKNYSRSLGKGVNGYVYALAGDDSKKILYAAGNFTEADNSVACNNIVSINYDESDIFHNTFNTLGDGLNGTIRALFLDGNDLYAGGHFDHSGTSAVGNIAKWNGNSWEAMGQLNGTVYSIMKYNNHIYAGGQFLFNKDSTTYQNIAYWDGVNWNPICYSMDGVVNALTVYRNNLMVGGAFTMVDTFMVNYLFSYNDTTIQQFMPGVTAQVRALDGSAGILVAGGDLHRDSTDTSLFGIQVFYPDIFPSTLFNDFTDNLNELTPIRKVNTLSKSYFGGKVNPFKGLYGSWNTGQVNNEIQPFASVDPNGEVFAILALGKKVFWGGQFNAVHSGINSGGSWSYPASNLAVWDPDYVGLNTINDKEAFFSIVPNPIQNYSTIQSSSPIQSIKMMDITGRIIYETKPGLIQKEFRVERNVFPTSGIYFVNIQTDNGTAQNQKLLVE
jgi:hypothetical protein